MVQTVSKRVKNQSLLNRRLRYPIPVIKLCLVHEGERQRFYPLTTPKDAELFLDPLRFSSEEQFVSLHLNAKNQIIGLHEVSHGTLAASLVHPREVFKAAILSNSYSILVCHNHPSGSVVEPSPEDIKTTVQLLMAGKIMGVNVIDHLILSPNQSVYSMREYHGELWNN